MKTVNIHEAKTHLSRLFDEALIMGRHSWPLASIACTSQKIAEVGMSKLFICLLIVISISLAGCGVRYNWVPQGTAQYGPPEAEYQGTGIKDPKSEL